MLKYSLDSSIAGLKLQSVTQLSQLSNNELPQQKSEPLVHQDNKQGFIDNEILEAGLTSIMIWTMTKK